MSFDPSEHSQPVPMRLLDELAAPSGKEEVTQRPAWRVSTATGEERWAFVQMLNGRLMITGYPTYNVRKLRSDDSGPALVGAGTGALIGASLGGPPGAIIGGLLGLLLGAGARGK